MSSSRPAPLSGFPEFLPAQRVVELHVIDTLRAIFELHGFASIETRATETLDQLLRKGEIDNEVYVLRRLHAESDDGDARLGLHYDLTVPFARRRGATASSPRPTSTSWRATCCRSTTTSRSPG